MLSLSGAESHPFPIQTIIPPAPVEQVSVFQEGPESIPVIRAQIEAIDRGIIGLLIERAKLSARVQAIRKAAGGVKVETGQEGVVLSRYAQLGRYGREIGESVLHLCRGDRR